MRVVVIMGKKGVKKTRLMLELLDKKTIKEVRKLIGNWKCSKAISDIVSKGKIIRELKENDVAIERSDLILTDTNAYWNLV